MEETVPSRVQESPILSPQRKASPSSYEETGKPDNFATPPSEFLQSAAANANDVVGPEIIDFGITKALQVETTVDRLVLNTDDTAVSGEIPIEHRNSTQYMHRLNH
jgi:hypothetical protein